MNARVLLLVVLGVLAAGMSRGAVTNERVQVYMPDGQLKSHLLRVYVTADITEDDHPTLTLRAGQLLLAKLPPWAERTNTYLDLARFQQWTETVDGQQVSRTGTLLLFDFRKAEFPFFKACMRITPVVTWGSPERRAVGARAVYLGNMLGAALWTAALLGAVVLVLYAFTRFRADDDVPRGPESTGGRGFTTAGFTWLLRGTDGRLSLSKTQAAVWTLCIGAVVFASGLTRLEPPAVPETLVALMGLSLATRTACYLTEESKPKLYRPRFGDLIRSPEAGRLELSITKAQMFFWTCLVACLFVVKSLMDGVLWDVPWPLVALMGMSQTTYVVPVVKGPKPPAGMGA